MKPVITRVIGVLYSADTSFSGQMSFGETETKQSIQPYPVAPSMRFTPTRRVSGRSSFDI